MIVRVARHTNNLEPIFEFYTNILNLNVLGSFNEHDNYNGIFLGMPEQDWHLEFTQSSDKTEASFDEDDLLVFYPTSKVEFEKILENIEQFKIQKITAKNPYWNKNGVMILDPDGYRVVISPLKAV